jgi:hypothetical protein
VGRRGWCAESASRSDRRWPRSTAWRSALPGSDVVVTPRDRRAQVVIDALTRNAAQPRQRADVALQEGLDRHVKGEVRRRRTRIGQRADQRVDAALTPGDLRPRRHLRPVDLQDLPRPVARALRRAHLPRSHHRHALADQIDRSAIAVVRRHRSIPAAEWRTIQFLDPAQYWTPGVNGAGASRLAR